VPRKEYAVAKAIQGGICICRQLVLAIAVVRRAPGRLPGKEVNKKKERWYNECREPVIGVTG